MTDLEHAYEFFDFGNEVKRFSIIIQVQSENKAIFCGERFYHEINPNNQAIVAKGNTENLGSFLPIHY